MCACTALQAEIDRLHREITALGAVNLAALQELQLATERKTFLDAQVQDLTQAMATLQGAIQKNRCANARAALGHLQRGECALWPHVPRVVRWWAERD